MRYYLKTSFLITLMTIFTACYYKSVFADEHKDNDNHSAVYSAEKGLRISHKTAKAISLKTEKVEFRHIANSTDLCGRIISENDGIITLCAKVPLEDADFLRSLRPAGGELKNIDTLAGTISGFADIVFTIPKSGDERIGDFRTVRFVGDKHKALAVPESALLESANGFFVYKESDGYYKLTNVDVGARENGFAEIERGLQENDSVVSSPTARLRLIELKLTKGGGHGH